MIPDGLPLCKGKTFIFGGDKPVKAVKPSPRLKTMETAPPSPDIVANVPSSA